MSPQSVSITSLFLASKIEETPCKLLDLLRAFDRCLYRRYHPPAPSTTVAHPYPLLSTQSPLFFRWREALLATELRVLAALGYSLLAVHPQRLVLHFVASLSPPGEGVAMGVVMQQAIALLNTAYLSPVACAHLPHLLAVAAIAITLHRMQHPQDELQQQSENGDVADTLSTDWLQLFDVNTTDVRLCIIDLCHGLLTAGDGEDYVPVSPDDEIEQCMAEGQQQWQELQRRESADEEQRVMAEIRRIAMTESLKSLRSA